METSGTSTSGDMFKLTADNFTYWRPMMEDHLYYKDLYNPILKSTKPEGKDEEEWEILNRKTVAMIRKYIDQSLFEHVSEFKNAYELWTKLETMIQKKTPRNKASLVRRLVKQEYKDGTSMMEHLNTCKGIVNQLSKTDMKIDDELQALLLLSSLPESWDTLVVTLSNSAPGGKLTMDTVRDSLLSEEARRKERGITSTSEANVAEHKGKFDSRGRSKSRGRDRRDKSRGRSKPKHDLKCFYCGKVGHKKPECWSLQKDEKSGNVKPDQIIPKRKEDKSTTAVVANAEADIFLLGEDNYLNVAYDDCTWIVDSGASFHVTPHKGFFSSYQGGDYGVVKMGNQVTSKIVGVGDVTLTTDVGCRLVLKDVRHVPDMRLNLISVGKLDDAGLVNYFSESRWKLAKENLVVSRGKKEGSLYVMQGKINGGEANSVRDGPSLELWHKRLGHMSEKGLQILNKKGLLTGLKGQMLESCTHCLAGKQHRVSFVRPDQPRRRKNILDLVHTDVCSMSEKSLGGAQYFVSFIDDHSRKVWVYLLKSKDQVLQSFKEYHAMVERETGKKLKVVRSDNGGEYCGPFDAYCRAAGIKLEKTPPKTPQLNGLAERMNRTIEEKVRSMLANAGLPKSFWGEAVKTAVDLINLSPSRPLEGEIPEEVWTGRKAAYDHLKVFGCRAFVHIPKDERAKLDAKMKECIYLGSPKSEFGFRLWDPINKKIVRSRDVIFHENETIHDISKPKVRVTVRREELDSPVRAEAGGENREENELNDQQENVEDQDAEVRDAEIQGENEDLNVQPEDQTRNSTRVRRPSTRYPPDEYTVVAEDGEPQSYDEAMTSSDKDEWEKAMQDEMKSLHENQTYELTKLPQGRRALKNKWVYKIKNEDNGQKPRYKARIVVKGCNQKKGVDFEEIFSPVVKMTSIRTVLAMAASMDLEVEQMDVKTAFLHGNLEEEIYMEQPEGFQAPGQEDLVCRLKKSLYGLKQAPRQWYKKFESFMIDHKFVKTEADHCVFVKRYETGDFLVLLLYVDDMLIVGQDKVKITALKKALSSSFAMKDLGPAKQILGIKIIRDRPKKLLWLSQEKYIEKILKRFSMDKAKTVSTPLAGHIKLSQKQCPRSEEDKDEMLKIPYQSAVGSLMYAMVCTRPDLAYAVGMVSRYLSNPGKEHWEAVKWIFKYLRGTTNLCLRFGEGKAELQGFTDADLGGDADSRKSTTGYLMTFAGGAVSWQSRLQKCVALSTTEAEYIAVTEASKEMMWMKKFLLELGHEQDKYELQCDNQSAIHLAKNSTYHSRSKHIDVRYHWIRDVLEDKQLELVKVHTDLNWSDMMTKSVPARKFEDCCEGAGLITPSN